jgi:myo-inositol-1(or 4)-monophosphatase
MQCCELARETGRFILKEGLGFSRDKIEIKSHNQLVSYVDLQAEKMLVKGLRELIPEAGFITEENTISKEGKVYNWIIDPLDGTTNVMHSIPVYSISIGLTENGALIMGIVYEVNRDECFYAWKGSPAYMNEKEIRTSGVDQLGSSLIATGFPYYDYKQVDNYMEVLKELMKKTSGIRRMGSAAVDLVYVACGRFEAFYEYGLNAWDVAGGAFIVQQAGGRVCDFKGGVDYVFGKEIIACEPALYEEFLEIVRSGFKD